MLRKHLFLNVIINNKIIIFIYKYFIWQRDSREAIINSNSFRYVNYELSKQNLSTITFYLFVSKILPFCLSTHCCNFEACSMYSINVVFLTTSKFYQNTLQTGKSLSTIFAISSISAVHLNLFHQFQSILCIRPTSEFSTKSWHDSIIIRTTNKQRQTHERVLESMHDHEK